MPTSNEQMYDAALRHQTYVLRYSSGLRNKINDLLDDTEEDVAEKILAKLSDQENVVTSSDWTRLRKLSEIIFQIRGDAWKSAGSLLETESSLFADHESNFYTYLITSVSPVIIDTVSPHPETLRSIVEDRPFEGKLLSSWVKDLQQSDINRITKTINSGVVQGRSAKQISRDILGTIAAKGKDGIVQRSRNSVDMLARTAIQHVSNNTRREISIANADTLQRDEYVATLDGRTTLRCRALDGKLFKPGEGPHPPLHPGCRSTRVMYISQDIGTRPSKPVTERLLLKEYAEENNLGKVTSRDDLPFGTKGAFDEWSRRRIRQIVGPVPARTNYNDWLKTQSEDFQLDTLGKTKFELFKKGDLSLDRFVDSDGTSLTLKEIAQRDAEAFRKAGLDVSKFLN